MADNQAHADRLWDRLGKRGWLIQLVGPAPATNRPYTCIAAKGPILFKAEGTNRVEAVVRCVKLVEEQEAKDGQDACVRGSS